jgi:hypothetical protein
MRRDDAARRESARAVGDFVKKSNIVIRYIFYTGVVFFLIILFSFAIQGMHIEKDNGFGKILGLLFWLSPIFLVALLERQTIKYRKEYGLSLYKGVYKEAREIAERLERERNTVIVKQESNEVDKSDIGYWFSLLEKGAITKEEYEAKKAELMR